MSNIGATKSTAIGSVQYHATLLKTSDGVQVWPIMLPVIRKVADQKLDDQGMAEVLLDELAKDYEQSQKLWKLLLPTVEFENEAGERKPLRSEFELHFQGRQFDCAQCLAWLMVINFLGCAAT